MLKIKFTFDPKTMVGVFILWRTGCLAHFKKNFDTGPCDIWIRSSLKKLENPLYVYARARALTTQALARQLAYKGMWQ